MKRHLFVTGCFLSFLVAVTGMSQEISPGVKYEPAPDAVNAAAKVKLEKALANGAIFLVKIDRCRVSASLELD